MATINQQIMDDDYQEPLLRIACDLLVLDFEALSAQRAIGYQSLRKHFAILSANFSKEASWEGLLEDYRDLGAQISDLKYLLGDDQDDLKRSFDTSYELLSSWLDPDDILTDKFQMRYDPPYNHRNDWMFRILINDFIAPEEDYCLVVSSFFDALAAKQENTEKCVLFLGGCGDLECCGEGYWTKKTESYWSWSRGSNKFKISWNDVLTVANQIIPEIEKLPEGNWLHKKLHPDLPAYRAITDDVKILVELKKKSTDTNKVF